MTKVETSCGGCIVIGALLIFIPLVIGLWRWALG